VGGALNFVAMYAFRPGAGLIQVANSFEPVGTIAVRLMPYATCVFYELPSVSGFFRETRESKIRVDTLPLRRGRIDHVSRCISGVRRSPHDA
jgi:hypothetical protein